MPTKTRNLNLPILALVCLLLFACGPEKVARVNGHVLTRRDFDREITRIIRQFATMGQELTGSQLRDIEEDILSNLIETVLIHQHSLSVGVVAGDDEVREEFDKIRNQFSSEEAFREGLENQYHTEKSLREQLKRDLTVRHYIETEILAGIAVPDIEVREYYDSNQAEFIASKRVRVSHILVLADSASDQATKQIALEKIRAIQQKLKTGEEFSELAKLYSEGPAGSYGGDLGYLEKGLSDPAFEAAVFSLKVGEVSDVVESQFGYHLVTVTDILPEGIMLFEDIKDVVKEHLLGEKNRIAVEVFVESLISSATIERFNRD